MDYSGYGNQPAVANICLPENVEFHTYSGEFEYKNDGKLYLNVTGKSLTPFDSTNPSVVYIDNISINCCGSGTCVPAPNFTYETHGCSVAFHGTNTGDSGDFFWDFGDNSPIETGQNATHNYLFGGTFDVCLTIQCPDLEHGKTICQQISIPDTCDRCSTLPLQTASRCDTTGSWMTNFRFPVPKGFKSCTGDQLSVYSPDALMTVTSYQIDDSNPLSDTLCIAIRLTTPPDSSFEQNGATGYITLCSNGEVPRICRMFEVEAQACDNCRPAIENTAICDDLILNDKLRIYRGVITLTINTLGAIFCGATSLEAGFAVGNVTSNGTTYTITYTVSTTNNGLNKFSALLCFSIGNQRWCFPVNITLPPCTELPQDCAMNWSVKNMACAGVEGNNLVFNFAMSVNVGNWVICANGLFGTVDQGIVEVIQNPALLGGVLTFNVNMVLPCDSFVSGNVYNMRLYLCTEEGNLVCLFFPFRLFCQDCAEIGNRARAAVNKKDRAMGQYLIIPNPATDRISILIQDFDPEMQQEARLLNHTGSLVKSAYLSSDKTEIDLSQCYPGVYYVIISNNGALVRSEKVIIMR